jgi:hypothetical protein
MTPHGLHFIAMSLASRAQDDFRSYWVRPIVVQCDGQWAKAGQENWGDGPYVVEVDQAECEMGFDKLVPRLYRELCADMGLD